MRLAPNGRSLAVAVLASFYYNEHVKSVRETTRRESLIACACALVLLSPLLAAFWSGGGMADAFTTLPGDGASSARSVLIAATARSLGVGLLSILIAALIGIPAAWALAGRRMSAWRTALVILPLALPAPVAVSGWVRLIAPNATSSFALQLPGAPPGWTSEAHALLFSPLGAGCVLGLGLWPVVALNAWPGFLRARDASYEAARLYERPTRAFFRVVLPRCRGDIAAGLSLAFLLACNDFAVSSLLLVHTLPVEVHDRAALGKNAAAASAALPLVAVAALFCILFRSPERHTAAPSGHNLPNGLRSGKSAMGALYAGVALGVAVPMLACLYGVVSSGKALSVSFDAGAASLGLSVRLAAAAVLLACGLAALRVLIRGDRRSQAVRIASVFLLAIPGSFLGVSILSLQIDATSALPFLRVPLLWVALGFALRFLYVPMRLADEARASIDSALIESAALLGHGRWSRAASVVLPLSMGHLTAAAALVFALALGEVPVASILAPPGSIPATIWLFGQQHMGYDESVFALSLLLGAATCGTIAMGAAAARWAARQ